MNLEVLLPGTWVKLRRRQPALRPIRRRIKEGELKTEIYNLVEFIWASCV